MKPGNHQQSDNMQPGNPQFQAFYEPSQLASLVQHYTMMQQQHPQQYMPQPHNQPPHHYQQQPQSPFQQLPPNQQQFFRQPKQQVQHLFENVFPQPQQVSGPEMAQRQYLDQIALQNMQQGVALPQHQQVNHGEMVMQNAFKEMYQKLMKNIECKAGHVTIWIFKQPRHFSASMHNTPTQRYPIQRMQQQGFPPIDPVDPGMEFVRNGQGFGSMVNEFLLKILNMFVVQNQVMLEFKLKNQHLETTVNEILDEVAKLQKLVEQKFESTTTPNMSNKESSSLGKPNTSSKVEESEVGDHQKQKSNRRLSVLRRLDTKKNESRNVRSRSRSEEKPIKARSGESDSDYEESSDQDEDWSQAQKREIRRLKQKEQ